MHYLSLYCEVFLWGFSSETMLFLSVSVPEGVSELYSHPWLDVHALRDDRQSQCSDKSDKQFNSHRAGADRAETTPT